MAVFGKFPGFAGALNPPSVFQKSKMVPQGFNWYS